ncbi:MAG: acyl-CoA dehydrogenase family protein [Thermodesulfobacteriota bacterium]
MDFTLTKSQKEIQKAVRDFVKGEFDKDMGLDLEKERKYPADVLAAACDLGFVGIHFPEKYAGADLGLFENCLIAEELCRKDSTLGLAVMLAGYGAECVLRFGTDAQKEKYLPSVAGGKTFSAAAFLEAGQGFDLRTVQTTARKEGNGWVIDGKKSLVLNGGAAGFYIVLCRTDDAAPAPDRRMSMFVVDAGLPGISCRDVGRRMSCNMLAAADMIFDKVKVGADALLGKEGAGFTQVNACFNELRVVLAALAVGIAQGAYEKALDYIRQREQFGKKIAEFHITWHKVADMAARIEAARTFAYRAAWTFDQGKPDAGLAAMAKMTAAKTAVAVAYEAIQLYGGYGFMTEYEVEHFYRDAKFIDLFCGPVGVLRDVIAETILGKNK